MQSISLIMSFFATILALDRKSNNVSKCASVHLYLILLFFKWSIKVGGSWLLQTKESRSKHTFPKLQENSDLEAAHCLHNTNTTTKSVFARKLLIPNQTRHPYQDMIVVRLVSSSTRLSSHLPAWLNNPLQFSQIHFRSVESNCTQCTFQCSSFGFSSTLSFQQSSVPVQSTHLNSIWIVMKRNKPKNTLLRPLHHHWCK